MDIPAVFPIFGIAAVLVLIAGLYSIIMSRDLIRTLIGVEMLAKAVTILVITTGYFVNRIALAQTIAITIIIIEVAVTAVAVAVVLCIFKHDKSTDARIVRNLKG